MKRRPIHAITGLCIRKRKRARLHVKRRKRRIRRVVFKTIRNDIDQLINRRTVIRKARCKRNAVLSHIVNRSKPLFQRAVAADVIGRFQHGLCVKGHRHFAGRNAPLPFAGLHNQ